MKRLLVLMVLVAGTANADNAANAFATGFANALNRSMGGNPNDSRPQPTPQVEIYQAPVRIETGIHAIRDDGSTGPLFGTYSGCRRFVSNTYGFASCESIQGNF